MEGIIKLDETVYTELNEIIQEEVVEEQNLAMMGMLSRIGIQEGAPFNPHAAREGLAQAYTVCTQTRQGGALGQRTPPSARPTPVPAASANRIDLERTPSCESRRAMRDLPMLYGTELEC